MSTTTYCQPCDLSFSAIASACALSCASLIVVAKQSQLFQPIGGFSATDQNDGSVSAWTTKQIIAPNAVPTTATGRELRILRLMPIDSILRKRHRHRNHPNGEIH